MQTTPFLLNTGYNPCMGFEPCQCLSQNESVNEFVSHIRQAQEEARVALVKAKDDMAQYYN